METIIVTGTGLVLPTLKKLIVETEYDNGFTSKNTVIDNGSVGASNKALAIDAEKYPAKVARCKNAVHRVFDGETLLTPEIETIF